MKINVKWSKYIPSDKIASAKQLAFLSLPHQEAFYGGAAGGGKSEALLMGALAYCDTPGFSAIIFRRTHTDMKLPSSILSRAKDWLAPFLESGEVKYERSQHTFYFPSGARLAFGYLKTEGSQNRYASSEYQYIAFDELTHFMEDEYLFLFSRLRKTTLTENIPLKMRSACVDAGEVLTKKGWVDITEVKIGDEVYSPNLRGILELKKVTHTHKHQYLGPLVKINKKNLYMSMTPNHRVMYKKFNKDTYDLKEFDKHKGKCISVCRTPGDSVFGPGTSNDFGWDSIEFMKFLGIYLSDGSVNHSGTGYKVNITQYKGTYIGTIGEMLDKSPFNFCRCANGDWQTSRKILHSYLKPLGKSHQKYIPRHILENGTKEELTTLFNWLVMGDGSIRKNSITYNTCSKQLANDVEELGIRLGYKVQTDFQILENPKHNNRYVIYLTKNGSTTTKVDKDEDGRNDVSTQNYNGYVYCISVEDNQSFVIKQEGKIWLSGNSNPGSVGHLWVKKRFGIVKGPDGEYYGNNHEAPFIPARISDNPHIDQTYIKTLDKLGQVERERLKNGDWDVSDQSIFEDRWFYDRWESKSNGLNTWYHLINKNGFRTFQDNQMHIFCTVDSAASIATGVKEAVFVKQKQPSFSVISTWGITPDYDLLWLDNIRFQDTIPELISKIQRNNQFWQPLYNIIEKNGPGEGVYQICQQRGLPVKPIHSSTDKIQNSIAAQLRAERGLIWLPRFKPWLQDLEDELFSWTGSRLQTDDQIDTLSNAANETMELAVSHERSDCFRRGLKRAIPTSSYGIGNSKKAQIGGRERLVTSKVHYMKTTHGTNGLFR